MLKRLAGLTCLFVLLSGCNALTGITGISSIDGPALVRVPQPRGTLGYDLDFEMSPAQALLRRDEVPGGAEMAEIVRVGARAIHWAEVLQQDIAPESREQLWRRIDHIGHEPSADQPLHYAPELISAQLAQAFAAAPQGVEEIVRGTADLPASPPAGATVHDVIVAIRAISIPYSRAGRWLALYPYHGELGQGPRDLRPWLRLNDAASPASAEAGSWATLSADARKAWIHDVAQACPLGGVSAEDCETAHAALADQNDGAPASAWLAQVLKAGQVVHDAHFGVQVPHPGVKALSGAAGLEVDFFTLGIPDAMLAWIQSRVDAGWKFDAATGAPAVALRLEAVDSAVPGVVRVQWQEGVMPHVNAVGGDTITMDANTPQWLEQTQVTMSHEFGHVIGFPDCYVEFWEDSLQAFTEYALDPDDRMCALSGGTMERHRQAMLQAFQPGSGG